jgi:N-acetyl-1-D-myo-inositol-2-amino-2-deoxy-alpha-D-glucopyranoside deacetylase
MRELGVGDFRSLGGAGRYQDSGMMGLPDNDDPRCFWQADVDEAAADLVRVIREVRPQVLVTYDTDGGYGHPDHIQAHRVAMRAADLAADPGVRPELGEPWTIAKIYWNRVPRSVAEERFAHLKDVLDELPFPASAAVDDVPGVVDDSLITTEIDGTAFAAAKAAAMRPTPPRSRSPNRGSRSPTTSRSRCSPRSTTSWCAGSAGARGARGAGAGDGPVRRDHWNRCTMSPRERVGAR